MLLLVEISESISVLACHGVLIFYKMVGTFIFEQNLFIFSFYQMV
jgi:hypothetical protein